MEDELDIPIFSLWDRMEKGYCMECGKRKAKFQCDYITGKALDFPRRGMITQTTCDDYLCEKCTHKVNSKDYCKKHYEKLINEIRGG